MNQEQGYKFCPLDPNGGDCVRSCAWNVSYSKDVCLCAITDIARTLNQFLDFDGNLGVVIVNPDELGGEKSNAENQI